VAFLKLPEHAVAGVMAFDAGTLIAALALVLALVLMETQSRAASPSPAARSSTTSRKAS
jgi:hypothetical protein